MTGLGTEERKRITHRNASRRVLQFPLNIHEPHDGDCLLSYAELKFADFWTDRTCNFVIRSGNEAEAIDDFPQGSTLEDIVEIFIAKYTDWKKDSHDSYPRDLKATFSPEQEQEFSYWVPVLYFAIRKKELSPEHHGYMPAWLREPFFNLCEEKQISLG